MSMVLVFHNEKGLTTDDMNAVEKAIYRLVGQKSQLGISSVTSYLNNEQLKDQLISTDHKTVLTLVNVAHDNREIKQIKQKLVDAIADIPVEHYYTGSDLINEDVVQSSESGLKKTEWITVVFILIVLILVFRSPVTPFIPLLTVGVTYMASSSIVAYLVKAFHFPLSTFSQIFMVAILFGIGTDYCILLLSRFKEELARHDKVNEAIIDTYRTAGKTVAFSGLAAFAGFASIGLAKFNLYQSAVAVAVGVFVLMIALVTIVPFFMKVLGKGLFWPVRGSLEHKQSKIWGMAGSFALSRPLMALVLVAVIIIPLMLTYNGKLSFDSMNEINDSYDSVKGFNIISKSFNPGEAMPTTIVLKHDQAMDNPQSLAIIEKISREIAQVDNVSKVRSASRPLGVEVKDFSVSSQMQSLNEGLGQGQEGIQKVRDGLSSANGSLTASMPKMNDSVKQIGQLVSGTKQIEQGMASLQKGLASIQNGIEQGSTGAAQLHQSMSQIHDSSSKLLEASKQLSQSYQQMGAGLQQLSLQYESIRNNLAGVQQALQSLNPNLSNLQQKYPQLKNDKDFLTIQGTLAKTQQGVGQLTSGLAAINDKLNGLSDSMTQASRGFKSLIDGQQKLTDGLAKVNAGIAKLAAGLNQASSGQSKITAQMPGMIGGLGKIAGGQQQLKDGFASLTDQIKQLNDGLSSSVDGLGKVQKGIGDARDYLSGISQNDQANAAGWYVPAEAMQNEDFKTVLNTYMSDDRKVTTFDVILKTNPYSQASLDTVQKIHDAVARSIKGTAFASDAFGINGVSGIYADLRSISDSDYKRTVTLMLIAILLIMIVLLRSLIMPLYLIGGLALSYFSALAINQIIFVNLYGNPGINWTIPFFSFVILMALGVDYSIFLMDRFNEHRGESVKEAILISMKNMGTVIFSAAIILAGTFAAMLPSGVQSLLQIATTVLSGLLLYAFLILPLFVPVMVRLFGKNNWWPFWRHPHGVEED